MKQKINSMWRKHTYNQLGQEETLSNMERLKMADIAIKKSVNLQFLIEIKCVNQIFNINDKYNLLGDYDGQFQDFRPYLEEMKIIEDEANIKLNLKKGNNTLIYINTISLKKKSSSRT